MAYPDWYKGSRYVRPVSCGKCGCGCPDEGAYNRHFDQTGHCAGAYGGTPIAEVLKVASAVVKPKALHWGGKVYPLGTCVTCQIGNIPILPDNIQKRISQGVNVLLAPKGQCRNCVVIIAEALDKIGTEMTAARTGGEYK